jgi:hypothetical protein
LQVITNAAAAASLAKVVAANAAKNAKPAARGAAAGSNRAGQGRSSNRNRAGTFAGGRNQQARWRRESAAAEASYITSVAAAAAAAAVPNPTLVTNSTANARPNAGAGPGNSTSAQKPTPPKVRISRMSCFTSIPRASTSTKAVTVMQRMYRQASGGIELCGRYQLRCSETRNAACTEAEIKSGAWVWEYKPLSAAVCSEMKSIAKMGANSGFKDVLCCRASGCNKPDRAVDKSTKVLQRPLRASRARRVGRARAAHGGAAAPASNSTSA